MKRTLCSTTAMMVMTLYPAAGTAQTQQQSGVAQPQREIAEQCLEDLSAFAARMDQDQFWVAGWGSAYGSGAAATGAPQAGVADPAATTTADTVPEGGQPMGASPWSAAGPPLYGVQSPRNQIEVLYSAANVLAQQGNEDGCAYVLAELTSTYERYTTRLQEAGLDPAEVATWRQEQIALAQPVDRIQGMARWTIDDLTGTDVRNLQDERLGSVNDVVLDPNTGAITYLIVARGGFLGIGQEYVAVPWSHFRATPGLNTLVVDVSEAAMEQAPGVDPDSFGDQTTVTQQNEQVDQYWDEQG